MGREIIEETKPFGRLLILLSTAAVEKAETESEAEEKKFLASIYTFNNAYLRGYFCRLSPVES